MKAIPLCRSVIVFTGFFWAAAISCAGPDQAQTSAKPDAGTPPQTEVQTTQNTPKKKPVKSAAWHYFGDSANTSVAGQSLLDVWRPFGPNHSTPKVSPSETAPRQNLSARRLADLERQMWMLVNHDRLDRTNFAETGGRAQPLRWNEKLAAVARAHSRDMIEQRFFDHVDQEGRTPSARVSAAGIPWRASGENIAINGTVPGAEAAFMIEPHLQNNHRANILNANYTDVGIGIVQGRNGSLYITQDFVAVPANSRTSYSSLNK